MEKSIEGPEEGFHGECATWREFMLQYTALFFEHLKHCSKKQHITSTTIHTDNITRVVAVVGSYTAQMSSVYKDLQ